MDFKQQRRLLSQIDITFDAFSNCKYENYRRDLTSFTWINYNPTNDVLLASGNWGQHDLYQIDKTNLNVVKIHDLSKSGGQYYITVVALQHPMGNYLLSNWRFRNDVIKIFDNSFNFLYELNLDMLILKEKFNIDSDADLNILQPIDSICSDLKGNIYSTGLMWNMITKKQGVLFKYDEKGKFVACVCNNPKNDLVYQAINSSVCNYNNNIIHTASSGILLMYDNNLSLMTMKSIHNSRGYNIIPKSFTIEEQLYIKYNHEVLVYDLRMFKEIHRITNLLADYDITSVQGRLLTCGSPILQYLPNKN